MQISSPINLLFSHKYNRENARKYLKKYQNGMARRLSHWRDEQLVRRALKQVGNPKVVLDLPCGAGRFWPLLAGESGQTIMAEANSSDMISIALGGQSADVVDRVEAF